jgi:IS30 family transposase
MVSNRLAKEKKQRLISANTIYRAIKRHELDEEEIRVYRDGSKYRAKGFEKYLRRKGQKYKKQAGEPEKRGKIIISHKIEDRPEKANRRIEKGHIEIDTVIGSKNTGCVLTAADRKTRMYFGVLMPNRKAETINAGIESIIKNAKIIKTITPDRGKEFARHKEITKEYKIEFYFPLPSQPWARGTNENLNGALREYMPKHKNFSMYTQQDVDAFLTKINNRPRKVLNWNTPFEAFFNKVLHFI